MQPYFLPYIGYWELMAVTDVFVILDDAQFVRKGWINRNRLSGERAGNRWSYLTVPVARAPRAARINEIRMQFASRWEKIVERRFENVYGVESTRLEIAQRVISLPRRANDPLVDALVELMAATRDLLQLSARFVLASSLGVAPGETAQNRIISLVKKVQGTDYLNLPGGADLYSKGAFSDAGVRLRILRPTDFPPWSPAGVHLSILDGILRGCLDTMRRHLHGFRV